jgi:hypothetical protein
MNALAPFGFVLRTKLMGGRLGFVQAHPLRDEAAPRMGHPILCQEKKQRIPYGNDNKKSKGNGGSCCARS